MIKRPIIRINILGVILFFVMIPLIPPEGLAVIDSQLFYYIYKIGRIISMAFIFYKLVIELYKKRLYIGITYWLFLLFVGINLLTTIANNGDVKRSASSFYLAIMLGLLIELYSDRVDLIIKGLFVYLLILVIINGIYMYIFKEGMYKAIGIEGYTRNWLLGYKSSFQYYFLPLMCVSLILVKKKNTRIPATIAIILIHIETIFSSNKMLLAGLLIVDFLMIIYAVKKNIRLNALILEAIALVANFVFIFIINRLQWIPNLIALLFNKDIKQGRLRIWERTLSSIYEKPLFGHGYTYNEVRYRMYGHVVHAHNQVLEILFQGGILLLVSYIVLITYVLYNLNKSETYYAYVLIVSVFALLIMVIVEIYTRYIGAGIWALFFLSSKVDYINKAIEKPKSNAD